VARGLAYAHARTDADGNSMNIVHCDVCPHNILINTEGVPKLTDFGIARANVRKQDEGVSGKLPFVSPEQVDVERELDFRSDIFSLGVVLFYLLTNDFPRNLKQTIKEIVKDIKENNIRWELLPAEVDDDLKALIQKMMAQNPDDRFQDTSEMARALEYYIYKDGYGPTIVTLAEYMKNIMPGQFEGTNTITTSSIPDMDKTQITIKDEILGKSYEIDKTLKM